MKVLPLENFWTLEHSRELEMRARMHMQGVKNQKGSRELDS